MCCVGLHHFAAEFCSTVEATVKSLPACACAWNGLTDCSIRVYDAAGKVIETHEHKGDFKEP
jgi:hypothetical protein